MRQEINDPGEYRLSTSGFSIKAGWGDEKKIIAKYPGTLCPIDLVEYQEWLTNAAQICSEHNAGLTTHAKNYTGCVAAYIQEFDKLNQLVPVAYRVRGKKLS